MPSMKTQCSGKNARKKIPREKTAREKTPTPRENIPHSEFNVISIQLQEVCEHYQELVDAQGGTLPFAKKIKTSLFEVVSSLTMVSSKPYDDAKFLALLRMHICRPYSTLELPRRLRDVLFWRIFSDFKTFGMPPRMSLHSGSEHR